MARTLDIIVVVPPPFRPIFEGRREVSLSMPATAGVGEVVEALLSLYPRMSQHLAGDRPARGGQFLQLALDEDSARELAGGGTGLSAGRRLVLFSLSRPSPGGRSGAEG